MIRLIHATGRHVRYFLGSAAVGVACAWVGAGAVDYGLLPSWAGPIAGYVGVGALITGIVGVGCWAMMPDGQRRSPPPGDKRDSDRR